MISNVSDIYEQQQALGSNRYSKAANGQTLPAIQSQIASVNDTVNISREAQTLQKGGQESEKPQAADDQNLDEDEKRQVDQLKKRDMEVKAHERAHMAAGGGLVQGGASYTYQRGPDGQLYAVGGEVKIDTSSERDPDQTIQKMEQVKRAALAPAQPSGTDRAVAAQAAQVQLQAQMEKTQTTEQGENVDDDQQGPAGVDSNDSGAHNENDDFSVNAEQESGDAGLEKEDDSNVFNVGFQSGENADGTQAGVVNLNQDSNNSRLFNPYANQNQALFVGQQINISI